MRSIFQVYARNSFLQDGRASEEIGSLDFYKVTTFPVVNSLELFSQLPLGNSFSISEMRV